MEGGLRVPNAIYIAEVLDQRIESASLDSRESLGGGKR
jgi:hypothetical protein